MGFLAVIVTTVHTEPVFQYCIYLNWLGKAQEACKAQWITPVYISSLRNCFLIAHRRITSMAIRVWFKPETVAKHVRKTECCFPFMFGKLIFLFLSEVIANMILWIKARRATEVHLAIHTWLWSQEFYSQGKFWVFFNICVKSEGLSM